MKMHFKVAWVYLTLSVTLGDEIAKVDAARPISVFMNKVWPVSNPVETYRYYDFPFCRPSEVTGTQMSLGQVFRGDRLTNSLYDMQFGVPQTKSVVCEKNFTASELTRFSDAVSRKFVFEMVIEGLPVTVSFGSNSAGRFASLCTHLKFRLGFNSKSEVVSVEVKCLETSQLTTSTKAVPFYYSVEWVSDETSSQSLASLLGLSSSSSSSLHWISILNSLILAAMVSALVLIVLVRTVHSDLNDEVDPESDMHHHGWKLLHGDVFRPPKHRMWLCAAVGAGSQLFVVFVLVVLLGTIHSSVYFLRGTLVTTGVVLYMLSAAIAGYISARLYSQIGGVKWAWNILVTAILFTGPAFCVWAILNTVAIVYNSTAAFPFLTILQLFAMWALVTLPLTVVGGLAGRRVKTKAFPVKTNRIPRQTMGGGKFVLQMIVSGFVAFCSIYVELKYIFMSVWSEGHAYTLYGVLLIAVLLLLVLATLLTVLFTYFHLNFHQDYRWWWRAFFGGSSVAGFLYAYAVLWFFTQSDMDGVLQPVFFFLYSLLGAYAVALVIGTLSFASSYNFVWYIYSHVKAE